MNAKNTISLTEARKRIFELAEAVQKPGMYFVLTKKGKAKAVFLSAEEFETLIETLEVSRDFPDIEKDSEQAWKDWERGDVVSLEEVLAKQGYVLADKANKPYVARRPVKKSRKTNK